MEGAYIFWHPLRSLQKRSHTVKIVVLTNEMFAEGKYLPTVSKSNTRMARGHPGI